MTVLKNTFCVFYCADFPEYWSLFAKVINPYKFWLAILCEKTFVRPSL